MGGSRAQQEQDNLRARARERIDQGLLPRAKPARMWGGRGSGLSCNLCDRPILQDDPEMELEFEGAARSLRFHLQCQSIFEAVRRAPAEDVWTPLERALPPFDTVVEARIDMGAGRSLILGLTRVRGRADDATWLNATTGSPLPPAWRPIEWRAPAAPQSPSPQQSPPVSVTPKRA